MSSFQLSHMGESVPLSISDEAQTVSSTTPTRRVTVLTIIGNDIRTISKYVWAHRWVLCLNIGLVLALCAAVASSGLSLLLLSSDYRTSPFCAPGGDFDHTRNSYNPWRAKHLFQITLSFGNFTFAQAKAIDVAWDIVVGRGGQLGLSTVTFIVFSKSLNRLLERQGSSVSYNTFRAVVFESPSLLATAKFGNDLFDKDIKSRSGRRARWSIVWLVFASTYVVAFPSILSAMTGYSSNVQAYWDTGNSKILISNTERFNRVIYLIKDANRIIGLRLSESVSIGSGGLSGSSRLGGIDQLFGSYEISTSSIYDWEKSYRDCLNMPKSMGFNCALAHGVSDYIKNYPLRTPLTNGSKLTMSNRTHSITYLIDSPTLDIDVFNTDVTHKGSYKDEIHILYMGNGTISPSPQMRYTMEDSTAVYTDDDLITKGTCDNQQTYVWGFSFLLLFVFFVVTGVWVLGMYVMWSDAFWNSRLEREGRTMGFYRGVIDIRRAMRQDMSWKPGALELASESQIKEMLAAQENGGRIEFEGFNRDKLAPSRMHNLRSLTRTVSSLCGWTQPWTRLHWTWFAIFGSLTLIFSAVVGPLAVVPGPVVVAMLFARMKELVSRWKQWLTGLLNRSSQRHTMIPLVGSPELRPSERSGSPD